MRNDISKPNLNKETIAVSSLFFVLGLAFATWAARIPSIRDSAMLIPATLGYALLARGIGSVVMLPLTALLINKFGSKKSAILFGALTSVTLIPLALSPNWWVLSLALIVTGASGGGYNLSMNSLASNLEHRAATPKMSRIHSMFGVGNLSGALLGFVAANLGLDPLMHFTLVSIMLAGINIWAFTHIPEDEEDEGIAPPTFARPPRGIMYLGMMLFLAGTTESSVMNWVALFYSDFLNAGEVIAPAGYAIYAAALLMMRFMGDVLRSKFGVRKILTTSTIFASLGIIFAVLAQNLYLSSMGIFMLGIGVALVFPFVFSVAGKVNASALALVMTFGSIGEMVSQPIMGEVVQNFGLNGGFFVIAGVVLIISGMAWNSELLREA